MQEFTDQQTGNADARLPLWPLMAPLTLLLGVGVSSLPSASYELAFSEPVIIHGVSPLLRLSPPTLTAD